MFTKSFVQTITPYLTIVPHKDKKINSYKTYFLYDSCSISTAGDDLFIRKKLQCHRHGIVVPPYWHWSAMPMALVLRRKEIK